MPTEADTVRATSGLLIIAANHSLLAAKKSLKAASL